MKPDAFIPFYFRSFFEAIEAKSDSVGLGYLRAICHYWGHNNCKGLKDDDDELRRICRIEKDEWVKARAIIFDNDEFFTMDGDGLWHQKFAKEKWIETSENYKRAVENGKKGGYHKHKKSSHPSRVASSKASRVTSRDTTRLASRVTSSNQNQI